MNVCKECIAKFGFKMSDKNKTFETDEELYDHLEMVPGTPVIREGETEKECEKQCKTKGLSRDRNKCICEECKIFRGEKTDIRVSDIHIAKRWIRSQAVEP